MRQNQYQVNDRTHTTNTPRQDTHGQHWMSVRAMSAHFFTSLHPCLTQSGTYDGVESRGWSDTHSHCSAQFTTLITPNISIERPDAHLADGPTQDVAMANHRPYVRGFTHVFHYVRCFIYTRTTGRSSREDPGVLISRASTTQEERNSPWPSGPMVSRRRHMFLCFCQLALAPLLGPYPQAHTASQLRSLRRAPGRLDHRPVHIVNTLELL